MLNPAFIIGEDVIAAVVARLEVALPVEVNRSSVPQLSAEPTAPLRFVVKC